MNVWELWLELMLVIKKKLMSVIIEKNINIEYFIFVI